MKSGKSLLLGLLGRLVKIPTAYHLWCAERELRAVDEPIMTSSLRKARARNLDLLCAYRRHGEFPHNNHEPKRLAPCFVDSRGRQCAVAYLMTQSGASDTADRIVREANHARIREMHLPELDAWAGGTGLSKAELARIQPGYVPTLGEAASYARIIFTIWIAAGLAINSILFNSGRLICAFKPRLTTIVLGFTIGVFLICFNLFGNTQRVEGHQLRENIQNSKFVTLGIALFSIFCAGMALRSLRGKWRPTLDAQVTVLGDDEAAPASERVKVSSQFFKT